MRHTPLLLAAAAAALSTSGCSDDEARVTWHQDVAPLVAARCTGCHQAGGVAPFSLESYADVKSIAKLMADTVEDGRMPPWDAVSTDDCAPRFAWQDDPRLTDAEIKTLRAWADDGAPRGDKDKAAPLPTPIEKPLEGVTHTLAPAQSYTTSGTQDQQICFVLDPSLTAPTWLTGLEVHPDNLEVAHHAVVMVVPPEAAPNLIAQGGLGTAFDCFGIQGVSGLYPAGLWVPGARPYETPEGTGIPVAPGSLFLLNLHYHPTGYDHAPDLSSIDLRLSPDQPPQDFVIITNIGNRSTPPELQPGPNDRGSVEFRIPANTAGHTETMVFPIEGDNPTRYAMTAMFPHMHYVGVDIDLRIRRTTPAPGEPAEECLVKVPRWDFDWQRTYFYDAPIAELPTVGRGDTLELRCNYDNTMDNPFVRRMLIEENLAAPIDVDLGDQTTDEMCLVHVGVIYTP